MATLNLFGILRTVAGRELRRLPMTADVQGAMSTEFQEQAERFFGEDVTEIPYSAEYIPDEDEILAIGGFELEPALAHGIRAADAIPAVTEDELEGEGMAALCATARTRGDTHWYFQAFQRNQVIRRSGRFLFLTGDHFDRVDQTGIQIGQHLAAIWRGGSLYFRSEHIVRRFLDLDVLFTDATDPQLRTFVGNRLWAPGDVAAFVGTADRWTRRKVAAIAARNILRDASVADIVTKAGRFGLQVETTGRGVTRRIQLPMEKRELKMFIRFLAEDLFEAPISGERFLANSKRPLR